MSDSITGSVEIAGQFRFWQGLRWVPVALGAMLAAALLSGGTSDSGRLSTVILVVAIGVLVADRWIDALYRRSFADVRCLPFRRWVTAVARSAAVVAVAVTISVDLLAKLSVATCGLAAAAAMVVFWRLSGGGLRAWPVLALLPAATAFAPLVLPVDPGRPAVALVLAVTGGCELVGGVVDHVMLVRCLRGIRDGLRG